jgi:hypothetical protein
VTPRGMSSSAQAQVAPGELLQLPPAPLVDEARTGGVAAVIAALRRGGRDGGEGGTAAAIAATLKTARPDAVAASLAAWPVGAPHLMARLGVLCVATAPCALPCLALCSERKALARAPPVPTAS